MLNLDSSDNLEGIASVTNVVEFTFSGVDGTTVVSKEGKLTDGQTTIHTAVGITRVYSLTLVNTHSAAVTVTVTKDPANAGTLYKLFSISLGIGYSLVFDGARFAVFDANGILMNGSAVSDTAYAASWDGVTNIAPSKNAVYDQMELKAPKASPTFTGNVGIGGQLTISGASRMRATRATAQSIPNATATIAQYDTETFDNLNEYDNVTNFRFTAIEAGYRSVLASLLSAHVAWDAGEAWEIEIFKNGTVISVGIRSQTDAAITTYRSTIINDIIYLAANDYIDVRAYHNQGAAVNTVANAIHNYFSVHRLS